MVALRSQGNWRWEGLLGVLLNGHMSLPTWLISEKQVEKRRQMGEIIIFLGILKVIHRLQRSKGG